MMKLYIYDHCPYCVRVRMIFGLRGIEFEEIILPYDDEKTPTGLIGQKLVPILIKEDGQPMGESLDIVRFIDEQAGKDRLAEDIRPEVEAWLEKIRPYYTKLTSPREIRVGLPEFAAESAVDYFVKKKTPHYGDFAENFANTEKHLASLHQDLLELEKLIHSPEHLGEKLGYEDIITFPLLRNLTLVKGINFPAKVQAYLTQMSQAANVPLYSDRAI